MNPPREELRPFEPFPRTQRAPGFYGTRDPEPLERVHRRRLLATALMRRDESGNAVITSATGRRHHQNGQKAIRSGLPVEFTALNALAPEPEARGISPNDDPRPTPAKAARQIILLADDDALVRGSLAAVLEWEGFVVDEAANGVEAVRQAIKQPPDLVLLDLNMPHWDGWTAFTQLDRVAPLLPIIVITARPNQYPKAVQLGVDAFMEKPLNIAALVGAIKRFINEEQSRHLRRITNRAFVTQMLASSELPPTPTS